MQGLADGYFVLPKTIGNYLASLDKFRADTQHPEFEKAERIQKEKLERLLVLMESEPWTHFTEN